MHFENSISTGQLIPAILTAIGILISLISSTVISIRNYINKNKPQLIMYTDQVDTITVSKFLVFKNTGSVPVKIIDLKYDKKLDDANEIGKFESLIGAWIVPGKYLSGLVKADYAETVNFSVRYSNKNKPKKIYSDTFEINFGQFKNLLWSEANPPYDKNNLTESQAIINAALLLEKRKI